MPIVLVYGISKKVREGYQGCTANLVVLRSWIKKHVSEIIELGLTEQQVTVFFPADHLTDGIGEDVIIFVKGLFDKPGRTEEVRQRLAQEIANCCEDFLRPHMETDLLVECLLDPPYDPKFGFGSVTVHALTTEDTGDA